MKTNQLPIRAKGGRFFLRKSFEGKQREFPLGDDLKIAESRCKRFLATFASSGLDTAILELTGKKVIKAGCNPDIKEMELLYRDFCNQSAKSPSPLTIKTNINSLKLIMKRIGVNNVGEIDKNTIYKKWFKDNKDITISQKRTFSSNIKNASSIFKVTALSYYHNRKILLENPFKGMELVTPAIQAYNPISKELRESIWNDCQTELDSTNAMIILLGLGAGLRRKEVECIKLDWFSIQQDCVIITIKETEYFTPKVNTVGTVSIPLSLYELLLKLRGNNDSDFLIPDISKLPGEKRLQHRFRVINAWLKGKGLKNQKAFHDLRKEYGSHIAKTQSVLAASKALRNTVNVAGIHYSGIADIALVDIQESFKVEKTPEQALADKLGITLEELLKKLG